MIKRVSTILMLIFVCNFLVGCTGDEATTNSQIRVRIIENYETLGIEIPPFLCFGFGDDLRIINGATGEVERILELDENRQVHPPEAVGDHFIVLVDVGELNDGEWINIATEYLIFDQNLDLIEEFIISSDDEAAILMSDSVQIGQNEVDEWIIYSASLLNLSDHHVYIYAYNFNRQELTLLSEIHSDHIMPDVVIRLMPDINKLAFMTVPRANEWLDNVAFGFIDLETLEVEIAFQAENVRGSWITALGEVLIIEKETQAGREIGLIHAQTGEVKIVPINENDYDLLLGSASTTLDGQLLFTSDMEE